MVQLTPCPRCKDSDCVLSVPAAYSSARFTESALIVMRDDETTFARRRAARATVNAALPIVAEKNLAMAPDTGYGCLGIVFGGFFGMFAVLWLIAHYSHGDGDAGSLAVGVILGLLSVFGFFVLFLALARQPKINAGKPAAEAIWRLGWYCCRCAVVYFQAGEEPAGVISGQPLTPAQFKHIVWTAGGYGKST